MPKRYIEVLVQSPNRFRTVPRRTVPRRTAPKSIADPNAKLLQRAAKNKRQKQAREKQRADLAEVQRTTILKEAAAKRKLLMLQKQTDRRNKRLQEASNNRRSTKQTQERVVIVISSSDSDSDSNNGSNNNDNQNSSAIKSNSSSVGVQRKKPTNYLLPVPLAKRVVSNKRNRDEEICGFGKHRTRTLLWVYKNDKSYCNWALGKKNTSGKLKEFVGYVKCKNGSASKSVAGNKRPCQNLNEMATPQRKVRQRRSDGISNTRR